jgi:hypothetical protein
MAQAAALQGPGKTEAQRLHEAFTALVRHMRFLRGRKFFKSPMVDADFARLGLSPPDCVRTEHTIVNELVEFEIRLRGIRELEVNFWIKGSAHHAKPAGFEGAVIVWDVLDAPPELPTDLTLHTMASKTDGQPHAARPRVRRDPARQNRVHRRNAAPRGRGCGQPVTRWFLASSPSQSVRGPG